MTRRAKRGAGGPRARGSVCVNDSLRPVYPGCSRRFTCTRLHTCCVNWMFEKSGTDAVKAQFHSEPQSVGGGQSQSEEARRKEEEGRPRKYDRWLQPKR